MRINPAYAAVAAIFSVATLILAYHSHQIPLLFIPMAICGMIAGSHLCDAFGETKAFGETWLDHQFVNIVLAVKHVGHLEG